MNRILRWSTIQLVVLIGGSAFAAPVTLASRAEFSPYDLVSKIDLREGMTASMKIVTVDAAGQKKQWVVDCKSGEYPLNFKINPATNTSPMCRGWEAWSGVNYRSIYLTDLVVS